MNDAPPTWIRDTLDLAEQDHASGHLTVFWRERVRALCARLDGCHAAARRDAAPCLGPNSHAEYQSLLATAAALADEVDRLRAALGASKEP